jgi:hypothetical protein
MSDVLRPVWPILSGVGEGLPIIVLLFFLLYARRDLRDRLVRLAARARIPVAALAIDTAAGAVGPLPPAAVVNQPWFRDRHRNCRLDAPYAIATSSRNANRQS